MGLPYGSLLNYKVSLLVIESLSDSSSEKCSECGMEGDPRQEFVQGWTQGKGTQRLYVYVCTYPTFKLLIVSMLYLRSFYGRLIYNVEFLEMAATTILITCLYLVSLCVHAVWPWDGELIGLGMENCIGLGMENCIGLGMENCIDLGMENCIGLGMENCISLGMENCIALMKTIQFANN